MRSENDGNEFKASIIIPSYNRYPLNLYTLSALEKQKFNMSDMEVIVVDGGSTDDTRLLNKYKPAYSFKYIRKHSKLGPSAARNIGLKQAKGEIIILLDAEMIVGPEYVRTHYRQHRRSNEQIVVVGRNKSKVYTHFFPGMNANQIEEMIKLSNDSAFVERRLRGRLGDHISKKNLLTLTGKIKRPIPLLDKEDINNISRLRKLSKPKETRMSLLTYIKKNPNSLLIWELCLGSNHSFRRSLLDKVGGYDESFSGWGMEDNEFAYRLYKAGAKFVLNTKLYRFHQEHPIKPNQRSEYAKNKILFTQMHPDIAVYVGSLSKIHCCDFHFMDMILAEHKLLSENFPGQFESFKSSIVLLLQQIDKLRRMKKPIKNLLSGSGLTDDRERENLLFTERNKVESSGRFEHLVRLFDMLIKK